MRIIRHLLLALAIAPVVFPLSAAHAQQSGDGHTAIADLAREWKSYEAKTQPIGQWRLLRGSKNAAYSELVPLNRYEAGVSGDPNTWAWSYGSSIFNQPGFLLKTGNDTLTIRTHPEKDVPRNENKGTPYVEWTSDKDQRVDIVIQAQNLGGNDGVKGGDGMDIFVTLINAHGDTLKDIGKVPVKTAKYFTNNAPTEKSFSTDLKAAQRLLFKIDSRVDGYGDMLDFNIEIVPGS